MAIGAIIFLVGILITNSTPKPVLQTQNKIVLEKPAEKINIQPTISKAVIPEPDNELEKAIEMAIADGVLSNNERKILKEIAVRKGLDYKKVIKDVEKQLAESDLESETELVDFRKKQGDDFEKFIVQKFDKRYYKVKEWAGDKYVNGVFAETTQQPDLMLELKSDGKLHPFSVECKWKQSSSVNAVQFCSEDQFKRYREYEKNKNIPVFIALGIGGKGIAPKQMYIVPLRLLSSNFICRKTLTEFEKKLDSDFFFYWKTGVLK
jgi:hypothetical protein